jgi:uncharacterized protein YecT (DUF1311 family)
MNHANKMNKLFLALTVSALATIFVFINAQASDEAFDGKGNLFVADYSGTISKYTPDGTKSTFTYGLMPERVYDVAFDRTGNLFVSDKENDLIFKFAPDGKKTIFATGVSARDLIFDKAGNLFVPEYSMDYANHSIFKFTPEGRKSTFASDLVPFAVAFDSTGNLFVSDGRSKSILKFTPDGKKSAFASGVTAWALELACDHSGNLFVADDANRSILKFAPDGEKSTFASDLGASDRGYDILFDAANNLFVVDSGSKAIFKFAPDGTKSTFATGDFVSPIFDKAGNLYVWESGSILKFTPDGKRTTFAASDRGISPDKKWQYVAGDEPKLVKAATNEVALDLSDECRGSVDWSPDSKRFAFNCGERGRWNGGTSFYQLHGDKWKTLKSPNDDVQEILHQAIAAQVKKRGLPKKTDLRLIWEKLEVEHWVDSNTAIVYGGLEEVVRENLDEGFDAHFLVTVKFDAQGNWNIVNTRRTPLEEAEKQDARDNISAPAQTTDQKEPSTHPSFRDADRHLNEIYNALRVRLSPPERDRLKKEQLAWINQRNAAAQVAKQNAQANPTEAADREMTKMTQARAAELEKRLKKAK